MDHLMLVDLIESSIRLNKKIVKKIYVRESCSLEIINLVTTI